MKRVRKLILIVLSTVAPVLVNASAYANAHHANTLCANYFKEYERKYKLPNNLLHAIAIIESSIHPWAVNYKGKSYYFETKDQAVDFVDGLKKEGNTNFDVGCMQVNYYFHGNKFSSIEESFIPEKNIDYAASYLRSLYDEMGSWTKAVSAYHAGQSLSTKGKEYARQIINRWLKFS